MIIPIDRMIHGKIMNISQIKKGLKGFFIENPIQVIIL